jgi:hypothetical protein
VRITACSLPSRSEVNESRLANAVAVPSSRFAGLPSPYAADRSLADLTGWLPSLGGNP